MKTASSHFHMHIISLDLQFVLETVHNALVSETLKLRFVCFFQIIRVLPDVS